MLQQSEHCSSTAISSPLIDNVEIAVYTLPNGFIVVTCPDKSLNCLVLVQSATDNPSHMHVGITNSDDDRTVVLSPGDTEVFIAVVTWNKTETIFAGQLTRLSFIPLSQPEPSASTSTFCFMYYCT